MTEKFYGIYHVWTGDTDSAYAVQKFEEKFGGKPDKVYLFNNQLWIGPIPDERRPKSEV